MLWKPTSFFPLIQCYFGGMSFKGLECAVGEAACLVASISQPIRAFNCFGRVAPPTLSIKLHLWFHITKAVNAICMCLLSSSFSSLALEQRINEISCMTVHVTVALEKKYVCDTVFKCWYNTWVLKYAVNLCISIIAHCVKTCIKPLIILSAHFFLNAYSPTESASD